MPNDFRVLSNSALVCSMTDASIYTEVGTEIGCIYKTGRSS